MLWNSLVKDFGVFVETVSADCNLRPVLVGYLHNLLHIPLRDILLFYALPACLYRIASIISGVCIEEYRQEGYVYPYKTKSFGL